MLSASLSGISWEPEPDFFLAVFDGPTEQASAIQVETPKRGRIQRWRTIQTTNTPMMRKISIDIHHYNRNGQRGKNFKKNSCQFPMA